MKTNILNTLLLSVLVLGSFVSCNKSEVVKQEEKRHEATVASIKALKDKELAAEQSNHKIAIAQAEAAELQLQADAKVQAVKKEQEKKEEQPTTAVIPAAPGMPAITLTPPAPTLGSELAITPPPAAK